MTHDEFARYLAREDAEIRQGMRERYVPPAACRYCGATEGLTTHGACDRCHTDADGSQ